jgi:hypothetical protein
LEAERRQHPRYGVRDEGIEIFSRHTRIHGKLENISKTGLAFSYIPVWSEAAESDTIDVMATGPARFYLSGLDCQVVYEIGTLAEDRSYTGAEARLCGMEFVGIEMEHKLEFFLKNFLNLTAETLP